MEVMVTVPTALFPPMTVDGVTSREATLCDRTVKLVVFVTPSRTVVTSPVVSVVTYDGTTLKVFVVSPVAKETVPGSVTAGLVFVTVTV